MKIGKWDIYFKLILRFRKMEMTRGISSMCEDMSHVLFMDYDNVARDFVVKELKHIQRRNFLTPFYLFTTKESMQGNEMVGNYHAVCLTKLDRETAHNILRESHCDYNYASMWQRNKYKSWVLRCNYKGKKEPPKYLGIIGVVGYLVNEISLAHLKFLETAFDVDYIDYRNTDNFIKIEGHEYHTYNG